LQNIGLRAPADAHVPITLDKYADEDGNEIIDLLERRALRREHQTVEHARFG
jgi:hypothetical protein